MTTRRLLLAATLGGTTVTLSPAPGARAAGTDAYWSQLGAVPVSPEPSDRFGAALAAGDFNGDDDDDLAIGAPGEALGSTSEAGMVHVLYGSSAGPVPSAGTVTIEDGITFPSDPTNRPFDRALAVRAASGGGAPFTLVVGVRDSTEGSGGGAELFRFDDDGLDDLAAGLPGEDIGDLTDAGGVVVAYGVNHPWL